jgi:hypothetical protein
MQQLFILLFLVFLSFTKSFPQVLIIDRDNLAADSLSRQKLSAFIGFGVNINKQKTTVLDLNQNSDIGYLFLDHALYFISNIKIVASGPEDLVNSGHLHLRYRFQKNKVVQPELFGQYQWEGARGLEERILSGANMRLRFQHDSLGSAYFGLGLMYEHERWNYSAVDDELLPPQLTDVIIDRPRLNSYLKISRSISPSAGFSVIGFVQASPDEDIKYPRIASSARLQLKITDKVDFAVSFSNIFDLKPVVPIDKHFFSLGNSLVIRL